MFHRIVWPIAIAETLIWAAVYYSFPAMLLEWERDLGWSKTELSGAFTTALAVWALLAPAAGRLIDRGHGRYLFAGSAALGGCLIALLGQATALWQFYAIWAAIGATMAGALYEPCFALLTRTFGGEAKRAITYVTLVAGFASTICFPAAHWLIGLVGWRGCLLIFGLVTIFVVAPLMWIGCRAADAHTANTAAADRAPAPASRAAAMGVLRGPVFWLLAIAFVGLSLNHAMLISHLLPILDSRGLDGDTAILAASAIGPMQVAGRLLMMAAERRVSLLAIAVVCFGAMALAALCLLGARVEFILIAGFVVLQGAGVGITSIVRPLLVAAYLGRRDFGMISGMLAMLATASTAAAPTLAAVVWSASSYDAVVMLALALTVIGGVSLLAAARAASRGRGRPC